MFQSLQCKDSRQYLHYDMSRVFDLDEHVCSVLACVACVVGRWFKHIPLHIWDKVVMRPQDFETCRQDLTNFETQARAILYVKTWEDRVQVDHQESGCAAVQTLRSRSV